MMQTPVTKAYLLLLFLILKWFKSVASKSIQKYGGESSLLSTAPRTLNLSLHLTGLLVTSSTDFVTDILARFVSTCEFHPGEQVVLK